MKRWTAGVEEQREVKVSTEDVVAGVRRMSNWKAPGPDGVRGFWFGGTVGWMCTLLHLSLVVGFMFMPFVVFACFMFCQLHVISQLV